MKISGKKLTFSIILFIFMICIIPVQAFSSDRLAVDLLTMAMHILHLTIH